ncbi:helix-turn-helix domain-containing protein [Sphingobacterium rhinopitheci]|uniref:helix-turn-helix domain-containing protein n=1 Tax=Sphingobacterium rhinopitheci TaxID=2781960 RepID=UPI00374D7F79|nr:helix-turn-helix transcriptional regulator [Sphingobacterium rhinopitheci]
MRNSKGITQSELATDLNLSRLTIQKVESGKNFNILIYWIHFQNLLLNNNWSLKKFNHSIKYGKKFNYKGKCFRC